MLDCVAYERLKGAKQGSKLDVTAQQYPRK